MANPQSKRQDEREATMAKSEEGERSLATRQYQDPVSLVDSMFERMQRDLLGTTLFNALLPSRGSEGDGGAVRVPRVQMRDTGDAIELTAELPGLDTDDVQVEVEDDTLTIQGENQVEEAREGTRQERYVCFYRQIQLPDGVDADQAKASYRNGVLSIRFPKSAERSNARQIPITSEESGQPGGQKEKAA